MPAHIVDFYEACYVPRVGLGALRAMSRPELMRGVCGWRAEWPTEVQRTHVVAIPGWLAVAGKILRRGTAMPYPRGLADAVAGALGSTAEFSIAEWESAAHIVAGGRCFGALGCSEFDSDAERAFFSNILPKLCPAALLRFWTCQVSIGSLTGDLAHAESQQRVDFLFCHPFRQPLVVEVDGPQHAQQARVDAERDAWLASAGVEVVRIPTSEINHGDGPSIGRVARAMSSLGDTDTTAETPASRWLRAGRRAIQLQQVVVAALERGYVPLDLETVGVAVIPDGSLGSPDIVTAICDGAVEDLSRLLSDVASSGQGGRPPRIRLVPPAEAALQVSFSAEAPAHEMRVAVTDSYFLASPEVEAPRTRPTPAGSVDRGSCERLLERVFGYSEFREGQFEAVERALRWLDCLVLLPTGSGKSIAFQLASFLRPGVGIVVDPILSLIEDQIDNLHSHGIDRVERLAGTQSVHEREDVLGFLSRSQYWLCYVSPERFQSAPFRDSLRGLTTNTPVSIVAVDEAHCVSEWGHDFRPAYLNLARTARAYCAWGSQAPPIMGLTGTASRSVLKDVQRELGIIDFDAVIVPKSFDRKELTFEAIPCRTAEKPVRLRALLGQLPSMFGERSAEFYSTRGDRTRSGLVFCPWVNGDQGIVSVGDLISSQLSISVPCYGSKAPVGNSKANWGDRLQETAAGFKRNSFPVMTCTKSFGMGIDKPNVRYTIHYNIPASIEAFYQEAGRAGRDGRAAHCTILYSDDYPTRTAKLLNPAVTDIEELRSAVEEAGFDTSDDITRALFFHNNSFSGVEADEEELQGIADGLGDLSRPGRAVVRFASNAKARKGSAEGDDRKNKEQALHRLAIIGAVADYTVDYSRREFHVELSGLGKDEILDHFYRYVAAYQRQRAVKATADLRQSLSLPHDRFVLKVASHLVAFVYEVIERGRRHALAEMLRVCRAATDGEVLRAEVLKYLSRSKFADRIDEILNADEGGVGLVAPLAEDVRSFLDAAELRGECARELESYPDQPSLRLLRAISEAMCRNADVELVRQNVTASIKDGVGKYGLNQRFLLTAVASLADGIVDTRPGIARAFVSAACQAAPDRRSACRDLLAGARAALREPLAAILLHELASDVRTVSRR